MSGPQLDQLDEVVTKIDSLGTQIQKVAYAVILLGEKQNKLARNHWTPPTVSLGKGYKKYLEKNSLKKSFFEPPSQLQYEL